MQYFKQGSTLFWGALIRSRDPWEGGSADPPEPTWLQAWGERVRGITERGERKGAEEKGKGRRRKERGKRKDDGGGGGGESGEARGEGE